MGRGFARFATLWVGKGMKEIFLINASYDNVSLPAACMRKRQRVGGQNKAWGVGKTDIWRGNGFTYAVKEDGCFVCTIKRSCDFLDIFSRTVSRFLFLDCEYVAN
jgi:hypothetical protein